MSKWNSSTSMSMIMAMLWMVPREVSPATGTSPDMQERLKFSSWAHNCLTNIEILYDNSIFWGILVLKAVFLVQLNNPSLNIFNYHTVQSCQTFVHSRWKEGGGGGVNHCHFLPNHNETSTCRRCCHCSSSPYWLTPDHIHTPPGEENKY